jgi:nitrite reductase (NO-forming)
MTLTVPSDEPFPHSNDMHASQLSSKPAFGSVMPGESKTYYYIAEVPGVFKYHCAGVDLVDMDRHVLSGMNGMTIVDPVDGYKPLIVKKTEVVDGEVRDVIKRYGADAYELQFVFNELYLDENGNYDATAMFQDHQTLATINGMSLGYLPNNILDQLILGDASKDIVFVQPWQEYDNQYQSWPIFVPVGEPVRIFIQNNGNHMVSFHIVGEIIDRVWQGNRIQAEGAQTWLVGASTEAIVEIVFDEPGTYVAVNHDYGDIYTGQAALFVAGNFFKEQLRDDLGDDVDGINYYAEVLGNPSDAIPPPGKNTILWPKFNVHGLYTDERAAEIATILEEWGIPQA